MANEQAPAKPAGVEVLGSDGNTLSSGGPLADIFNKIEEGKRDGVAAEEVLKQEPIKQEEGGVKESGKGPSLVEPKAAPVKPEEEAKAAAKTDTKLEQRLAPKAEEKKEEPKAEEKKEEPKTLDSSLDDISRESLRKQNEKKVEKKAEAKAEEKKEEEVPEDELKPLPHDAPKTTKRIFALLGKIEKAQAEVATTKKEIEARDLKLKALEDELGKVKSADPAATEAQKAQLEELAMLRRKFELETGPELKDKFDSKAEEAETAITNLLKDKGAGEPLLNLIKEEGGWAKFASSTRPVTLNDGKTVTAAELADIVSKNLPYEVRKQLEATATEQVAIRRDRERYVKEQQANATKYFEGKAQEQEKAKKAYEAKIGEVQETIKSAYKNATDTKDGWLKEVSVPENATAEQKAEIEEENSHNKKLQQLLQKSLATQDLKEAVEITFDSVRYYKEARRAQKLEARIESLTKELESQKEAVAKFKSAGRSTPRGGSISTTPPAAAAPVKPASLEEAWDRIGRGEVLTVND